MEYAKHWLTVYVLVAFVHVSVYSRAISDEKTPDQQTVKDNVQVNDNDGIAKQSLTSEEISLLLAGLEAESYQTRRESFVQLWQAGRDVLPAVQSAMKSQNKQRADSAATLDILIRLNVTADKPEEAADFIGQLTNSPELALVSLCQRGYWNVAAELLETNDTLRASLKSSPYAYARLNSLVDEALDQNDPLLAWAVIRQVLPIHQALWIAAKQNLEPPRHDLNDPTDQAWAAAATGNIAAAMEGSASPETKALIGLRNFSWKTLLQPDVQNSFLGNRRSASRVAANAVLLEFTGDLPASEQLWSTIFPSQSTNSEAPLEATNPAEPNGRPSSDESSNQPEKSAGKNQEDGASPSDNPASIRRAT